MELVDRILREYHARFKSPPLLVRGPGRINLLGEHVDYNDGFVLPGAIDRSIVFAMALDAGDRCNVYAADLEEGITFSTQDLFPGEAWVNYLMGVLDGFLRRGIAVKGVDVVFGGNIPGGAGLSSSAALCCGFAYGLNELLGSGLSRKDLALIAQRAEHEFAGVRCGIMDQYASLFSAVEKVLLLDCRTLTHEHIPFKLEGFELLLIDTHVKHALASSAYNERRQSCERCVAALQKKWPTIAALRDVTEEQLAAVEEELGDLDYTKGLYIIREMARVQQAVKFLQAGDARALGQLMFDTHWGLSQAYEVSCEELDWLVTMAVETESVWGARMMGGGFGGCTLNLIQTGAVDAFKLKVQEKYVATFKKEPDFYSVTLSAGTSLIQQ